MEWIIRHYLHKNKALPKIFLSFQLSLMKNVIALGLLLCTCGAFAQDVKKPLKVSRNAENPQKQQQIRHIQVEADEGDFLTSQDLWNGYDFELISNAASTTQVPKNEFESVDAYSARQKSVQEKPIYSSIVLSSKIALVVPRIGKIRDIGALGKSIGAPVGYDYDADSRKFKICAAGETFKTSPLGEAVEGVVVEKLTASEYPAQNSFGAKFKVKSIRGEQVTVAIPTGYRERCPIQLEVDGAAAQELLKSSGIVLLGRLQGPYFFEITGTYSTATLANPTETSIKVQRLFFLPEKIVLLDRATRAVIKTADW